MPLRLRLAVLFALATAAVILVAGVAFVLQLRVSVDASLDPGLRTRAAAVADELGAGLVDQPLPGVDSDSIVRVSTIDGQVLLASPNTGPAPLLTPQQRQSALTGEVSFTTSVNGERDRILATTREVGGRRLLVVVGTGTDVSDAAVEHAVAALVVGGPPAVVLAGLSAYLLAGAVLRPVERMRRQVAAIGDADLERRLAVPSTRDEIAALGTTMNAMLDRLQSALDRERAFVADAGHELRTPLAILRAELELAARPGRSHAALAEAVDRAGEETDRLIRLAEDLLLLARADNNQPILRTEQVPLPELLHAAARRATACVTQGQGVTVSVEAPDELILTADPGRIRQAVDNLLDNAVRHAPAHSTVMVRASVPAGSVLISVAEDGPGFPPDFLPHAFERFHRAEAGRSRDDGGTGLGLAIVRAIAAAHGGDADADNRPEGGAVVTLRLPLTHSAATAPASRHPPTNSRPRQPAAGGMGNRLGDRLRGFRSRLI